MRKINNLIIIFIEIIFFIFLASAHTIEKDPQIFNSEKYNIQFLSEPKFPITKKITRLDFIILDKNNNSLKNLNVKIELHKGKIINLNLSEEKGYYSVKYNFKKSGNYQIHLVINNKEVNTKFNLEIDNFGLSGFIRSGIVFILILILLGLMYRDCKR